MNLKTNLFSKKIYSILILIVVITTHSCKKDSYNALEKAPFLQGNGYGFNSAIFSVKDIDSTNWDLIFKILKASKKE